MFPVFIGWLFAIEFFSTSGAAQELEPLVVSVKPTPPFVSWDQQTNEVSGFSIDLIREIAEQMVPRRTVTFHVHHDLQQHLDAVESGQVDLGIAATSLTADRERGLDFSHPFYQSGLDIVVRSEGSSLMSVLLSRELLYTFLWLFLFLFVCANLIWLTEKGSSDMFDDGWFRGVGQGLWWTVVTMSTVGYGDFVPKKAISRLLGVVVIFSGIILFGVAVGAFSSVLTVQRLTSEIRSVDDLSGKSVAVVRNTIAEEVMKTRGAKVMAVENLSEALGAVESRETVAAVHDLPQLRHQTRDDQRFTLVGKPFANQAYGMPFPLKSELRKQINVALLRLMDGHPSRYDQLNERWFGVP